MIPTTVATAAINKYTETKEHTLRRGYPAIIKDIDLDPEILNDGTGHIMLSLDADKETLSLVGCKANKNELTFLADSIGLQGELDIDVVFVDKDTAVITLKKGTAILKHPDNFAFGISNKGDLVKPSKRFLWIDVATLFEVCRTSVRIRFNPPSVKIDNYVMNAMFSVHLTANATGGENLRTYKVTNIYTTLACGKFEFTEYDLPEIKTQRNGYYNYNKRGDEGQDVLTPEGKSMNDGLDTDEDEDAM